MVHTTQLDPGGRVKVERVEMVQQHPLWLQNTPWQKCKAGH